MPGHLVHSFLLQGPFEGDSDATVPLAVALRPPSVSSVPCCWDFSQVFQWQLIVVRWNLWLVTKVPKLQHKTVGPWTKSRLNCVHFCLSIGTLILTQRKMIEAASHKGIKSYGVRDNANLRIEILWSFFLRPNRACFSGSLNGSDKLPWGKASPSGNFRNVAALREFFCGGTICGIPPTLTQKITQHLVT